MSAPSDFVVVILSHGRCDSMATDKTLRRQGYTGPILVMIDDEDDTAPAYRDKFGDDCIIFNKRKAEAITDTADLVKHRKAVVFARNAVFDKVRDRGYKYFLVLDDDYTQFMIRFNHEKRFISSDTAIKGLDSYFSIFLKYYQSINADTITFSQGGDYFGGIAGSYVNAIKTKRKAMNSFFCSVDRPFKFFGRINEDVNYYVHDGRQGKLAFQTNHIQLSQGKTQENSGGLTDIYKHLGTYVKSFYTVLFAPSCVTVEEMGAKEKRLHHKVDYNGCCPKILREDIKK